MKLPRRVIDGLVLLVITLFSTWLMYHTFDYQDDRFIFSSKVWSDFGAHIPLIRTFSLGSNFPPEYATFPGEPIRYHFLFYLIVGLLEKSGVNLALALNGLSIIGFSAMLYMVYRYALLYSKSHLAGILAIILVIFNGTLSFLTFFQKNPLNQSSLKGIIQAEHFASFGPWDGNLVSAFWNLNIYTNQRHLSLAFAMGLCALYPLIRTAVTKKPPHPRWWIVIALTMLLLPWIHQAMVMIIGIIAGMVFLGLWKHVKPLFLPYLTCALFALPGYIFWRYAGITGPIIEHGYLSPDKSLIGIGIYWFHNLGLYLLLSPVLWFILPRQRRVILTAFLPLFAITNLFRLSTDMINNHKLINFLLLYLAIETGIFLARFFRRWWTVVPGLLLLISLTFSGFIDFFPILNDRRGPHPDVKNHETAAWINSNTPRDSIFLTTHYLYHPASLAGRKIFLDYGYFNWSMGYDETLRRRFVREFFAHDLSLTQACHNLRQFNLDYIIISPGQGEVGDNDPHEHPILLPQTPLFTSTDGYTIYSVNELCNQLLPPLKLGGGEGEV
jgi:hypothetical protein